MRSVRWLAGLGALLVLVIILANTAPELRGAPNNTKRGTSSAAPAGPTAGSEATQSPAPAPSASGSGTANGGTGSPAGRQDGNRSMLTPAAVAPADTEIPNPLRGSYEWLDNPPQPAGWPVVDSYVRLGWRELEPQQGAYNFSSIDQELAQAQTRHGKLGIRIMPACTGCASTSIAVPDYLKDLMPLGFWFQYNGTNNYAPDWNSAPYLDRLDALLQALGKRYDGDPRLGWVEISGYGDWGEWHTSGWPYPSPGGAMPITDENALRIVDMNVRAFPHKRLLMLHDHEKALAYALSLSPAIGVRNDCLGDQWFTESMTALSGVIKDRWKTAPTITEYCYQHPQSAGFRLAAEQIQAFHVAMIGNGNMDRLSSFSAPDQELFRRNNQSAGYRFVLNSVSVPSRIAPGSSFTVDASWSNIGVTPSYLPWKVSFRLSDPATGAVVWQGPSKLDLTALLPTRDGAGDHPVAVADTGVLPATVRSGTYNLSVIAVDPTNYYPPLELSIAGRRAEGSYALGTATVG